MINILLADDHQIILDGFTSILESIPDMKLVGTALNGQLALELIEREVPDVILLDINMPGLNGVEVCKRIAKTHPEIKIIALSMYKRQSYIQRMMQFGASGYLLKDDSAEEIQKAIRVVYEGSQYFSSQLNLDLFSFFGPRIESANQETTAREIEVLECIAHGLTNQEISEKLYLSQHTVESHRRNVLAKLNAKNTADLIRIALEKGLI